MYCTLGRVGNLGCLYLGIVGLSHSPRQLQLLQARQRIIASLQRSCCSGQIGSGCRPTCSCSCSSSAANIPSVLRMFSSFLVTNAWSRKQNAHPDRPVRNITARVGRMWAAGEQCTAAWQTSIRLGSRNDGSPPPGPVSQGASPNPSRGHDVDGRPDDGTWPDRRAKPAPNHSSIPDPYPILVLILVPSERAAALKEREEEPRPISIIIIIITLRRSPPPPDRPGSKSWPGAKCCPSTDRPSDVRPGKCGGRRGSTPRFN